MTMRGLALIALAGGVVLAGLGDAGAAGKSGAVVAWGCGDSPGLARVNFGQCRVPAAARSGVIAIAANGYDSLALTASGRVIAWGCVGHGGDLANFVQCRVPAAARHGVVAISAGETVSLALTREGRVVAWGCVKRPTVGSDAGNAVCPPPRRRGSARSPRAATRVWR
jgi:alpha-tubulin suppressor-like RCC1 family protein